MSPQEPTRRVLRGERAPRQQKPQFDTPRPIPPLPLAHETLAQLLHSVRRLQAQNVDARRIREASALATLGNDIEYRLMPMAKLTACSHCDGFRTGNSKESPRRCVHIPTDTARMDEAGIEREARGGERDDEAGLATPINTKGDDQ